MTSEWLPPIVALAQDHSCPDTVAQTGAQGPWGCGCHFCLSGSAGSKAEHASRRQDTDTISHKYCPGQGLPSTALMHRTQVKQIQTAKTLSTCLTDRDTSSLVKTHTHSTLQVHKNTHIHRSFKYLAWPFCPSRTCLRSHKHCHSPTVCPVTPPGALSAGTAPLSSTCPNTNPLTCFTG